MTPTRPIDPIRRCRHTSTWRKAGWGALSGFLLWLPLAVLHPATAPAQSVGASPRILTDIQYGTVQGVPLVMDVYLPEGGGTHPGVVLVHPGGFVAGDKSKMSATGTFLAGHGYVGFSIEYRSAREVAYPAAVDDTRTAIAFIRAHASEYGTDPLRIGILGASAGGTIGTSAADEGKGILDEGTRVAAVVTWSAPFDFVSILPERPDRASSLLKYVGIQEPHGRETIVPSSQQDELLRRASPINYVDPSDPPMLIANAPQEFIPFDQAEEMKTVLEKNHIPVEVFKPSHGHALDYTDEALQPSVDFLDRYLRDYQPQSPEPSGSGSPQSPEPSGSGSGSGLAVVIGLGAAVALLVLLVLLVLLRFRRRGRPLG
jgi:acetyl esterase